MATSDFRPEVEIRPFRACAMHPAIIIGTIRNCSFIMDVAIGQIPCSTERISSIILYYIMLCHFMLYYIILYYIIYYYVYYLAEFPSYRAVVVKFSLSSVGTSLYTLCLTICKKNKHQASSTLYKTLLSSLSVPQLQEIGVEEHEGDVRFYTGSRNTAVSRMRNEKYAIQPLFRAESPKFLRYKENWDRETRW